MDDWKNVKSVKEHDEKSGLKPIQDENGNVMMHHWSSEKGIEALDPGMQGRMKPGTGQTVGLRGNNFRQGQPAIPYTSFGLNVGHPEGYAKEQGLGDVEYIAEIPFEKIYDLRADPLSLRVERDKIIQEQKISPMDMKSKNDIMSKLIKDKGYAGFFVSNGAGYGLTAAIWESVIVEQVGPRNKEAVAKASTSKFENMKLGWGVTTEDIAEYRDSSKKLDFKQKDVLKQLANKKNAKNPKINLDDDMEWASAVIKNSNIETLGAVQKIPTFREMIAGVGKKVAGKLIRQGGGQGYIRINNGTKVKARLDIPAYKNSNTWVVTIQYSDKSGVIGYAKSAVLNDVEFGEFSAAAKRVAMGGSKSTFATMEGSWLDMSETQAEQLAEQALASPEWVEVGMNPNRYGYFYIKETGQRILSSPQVVQVGPLVMANITGASIKETPHSELLANPV